MPIHANTTHPEHLQPPRRHRTVLAACLALLATAPPSLAHLEETLVHGRRYSLQGESLSASEGVIGPQEIQLRPMLRTGEVLEFVPGMVVTQHSGSGKANQYFLRGFNLDHGTDFATTVDGMPVNMRSHGHGQGYTDLNFIVPEFVAHISYQKGAYRAASGDFSAAGSAQFELADRLPRSLLSVELGADNYRRQVAGINIDTGGDHSLLLGAELQRYDGPWRDIREDIDKHNGLLRYSGPAAGGQLALTLMAYENQWNAADQIPQRAVDQGLIDELGSIDTNVGGESDRYSLSGSWQNTHWRASAYVIDASLELFSNFTYQLDDPADGDQFEQVDQRRIYGGEISHDLNLTLQDKTLDSRIGAQLRYDDIDEVALYRSRARQRLGTVRQDRVDEWSLGLYWDAELAINHHLSASLGLRYDHLDVDVVSDEPANSGRADDGLASLRAGLRYAFSEHWAGYANIGQGFHSNDARGATIAVDPVNATPAQPVDLLVRSEGAELGMRYFDSERLNVSAALWLLELDSELLFVGDAGNTEAGRASRRYGIELAAYYWLSEAFSADLEVAATRSRFTENTPGEGSDIDGAVPLVVSAGLSWSITEHWRSSLRLRHFGRRPLDSFGEEKSDPFTVTNLGLSYERSAWALGATVLNLFDSDDHDITYLYTSRLPGEPVAGVEDRHFHPIEPRTLRFKVTYHF